MKGLEDRGCVCLHCGGSHTAIDYLQSLLDAQGRFDQLGQPRQLNTIEHTNTALNDLVVGSSQRFESVGACHQAIQAQLGVMHEVIDAPIAETPRDHFRVSPIAQESHNLEKLVSLIKRSADQTNFLALKAAIDAEIESLSRQVTTLRTNYDMETQRKSHRHTLDPVDNPIATEHSMPGQIA